MPLYPTITEIGAIYRQAYRRARLRGAVEELLAACRCGEVTPTLVELRALAQVCRDHDEPLSAARIARYVRVTFPEADRG